MRSARAGRRRTWAAAGARWPRAPPASCGRRSYRITDRRAGSFAMAGRSPGEVRVTTLDARLHERYGRFVRRPIALLVVVGGALGIGATALAQGGGSDEM